MKILPPPGPARTRQLILLGILLVVLTVVVWKFVISGVLAPAARPAGAAVTASNAKGQRAPTDTRSLPQPVQLDKLASPGDPPETTRNPFRFGMPPAPPPKPAPPQSAVKGPAVPVVPPGPAPPPPITLKFIGRVVLPDKRVVAALSDNKGSVFEATEGQVVDGRYRVVKIGEESLIVEYVNGTGRTTLPMR